LVTAVYESKAASGAAVFSGDEATALFTTPALLANRASSEDLLVGAQHHFGNGLGGNLLRPFSGNIGEILIYNPPLDGAARETVIEYLKEKWGVSN
jgi:hypothetical protein